jgi:myo-inositol 2-dehydrogenase/D-chiro-inositol 1-dehydrogenase
LLDSFARWVDVIRALIGEVESLTALGDPPGGSPERSLTVQFRGRAGRSAELRLFPPDARRATRIALEFEREDLSLEMPAGPSGPSILSYRSAKGDLSEDLPPSDPHEAVLDVLGRAVEGRPARPDLLDGTRAMELRSAAARSLRRGRAVDLHYEEVSEANNFKTVMTSVGCMVLLGCLVALPAALVGPALGVGQTIYIAYAIPPLLVVFALLQVLRLAVKPPAPGGKGSSEET